MDERQKKTLIWMGKLTVCIDFITKIKPIADASYYPNMRCAPHGPYINHTSDAKLNVEASN
jgi:hypothetical protein